MRTKPILLLILLSLMLFSSLNQSLTISASPDAIGGTQWIQNAAQILIDQLWDSSRGALKTSPIGEPYNYWIDDQGKSLELLAAVSGFGSYQANLRNFIASRTTYGGMVLARDLIITPYITSSNPVNFDVSNRLFRISGDLSKSRDLSFQISYLPHLTRTAIIQGHVFYYNGTDKDLSHDAAWTITSYSIIDGTGSTPKYVTLRQIWDKTDWKLTLDYTLRESKPYLEVKYAVESKEKLLSDPKIVVPLDQLDYLGPVIYPYGPHKGMQYVWIPGMQDQISNDTTPQHFLIKSLWNQTWYMVHCRDKADGVGLSLAIIADWAGNKTTVDAVDNALTGSPLPEKRLNPNLHWLKQYVSLGTSMPPSTSKTFTVRYYFLHAHDWTRLNEYQQVMQWNLDNKDLSQTYQYGALVHGLMKSYESSGQLADLELALKLWDNWHRMFTAQTYASGKYYGTYLQSLPFMLRGSILLYKAVLNPEWQAKLAASINLQLEQLLYCQQMNPSALNYGNFQEWRWFNATSGTQYWGNSYLDFLAPAMQALIDYYHLYQQNTTVLSRLTEAKKAFLISPSGYKYIVYRSTILKEEYFPVPAGLIGCHVNATSTGLLDADLWTYKSALILQAWSSTLAGMGWQNSTITQRAASHLWWASTLTSTATAIATEWSRAEVNSETQPWGAMAWRTFVQAIADGNNQVSLRFINSNKKANLTSIIWTSTSPAFQTFKITVQAKDETISLDIPSTAAPAGLYVSGPALDKWSWTWDGAKASLSITYPSPGSTYETIGVYPSSWKIDYYPGNFFAISWTAESTGIYNFTGIQKVFNSRIGVRNSTCGFDVSWGPIYFTVLANVTTTASHLMWFRYGEPFSWIYSNRPMTNSIYGQQYLMGTFTVIQGGQNIRVKADTGVRPYGPRIIQIANATAPYGNGTYSSYRYDLTVLSISSNPVAIYATWEEAGPGTGTMIAVTTISVIIGGIIYAARRKIKK